MARVSVVFLIIFLFLSAASNALAAEEGALTIAPAVSEVILKPNEIEKKIEFTLQNKSNNPVILDLFPVNFRSRGDYGQIGFDQIGTYSFPLVSYVILQESTIELLPKQTKKISAVLQNRPDLSPGGHYVALIARLSRSEASGGNSDLYPALTSLILIRKQGGEQFNLSLKDTNFPRGVMSLTYPSKMTLLYQNEGNVHVVPYGKVEIRDIFGRLIKKGIINTSSLNVLPSSRRYLTVDLSESAWSFPLSLNSVEVKGRDSLDKTRFLSRESYIYVNPYLFLILPISALIYRKRKKLKKVFKVRKV
jgi:hypothetical protein